LLTSLALSTFMASVDLKNTLDLVRTALADCPRVQIRTREEVLAQA
jgi:hypothetical protein